MQPDWNIILGFAAMGLLMVGGFVRIMGRLQKIETRLEVDEVAHERRQAGRGRPDPNRLHLRKRADWESVAPAHRLDTGHERRRDCAHPRRQDEQLPFVRGHIDRCLSHAGPRKPFVSLVYRRKNPTSRHHAHNRDLSECDGPAALGK